MLTPEQPDRPVRGPADRRPAVAELAEARLRGSGYPVLKHVRCEYDGGKLTLRGCLPTYYLKQVALAAAAGVEGVEQVVDGIEVRAAAGCEGRQ